MLNMTDARADGNQTMAHRSPSRPIRIPEAGGGGARQRSRRASSGSGRGGHFVKASLPSTPVRAVSPCPPRAFLEALHTLLLISCAPPVATACIIVVSRAARVMKKILEWSSETSSSSSATIFSIVTNRALARGCRSPGPRIASCALRLSAPNGHVPCSRHAPSPSTADSSGPLCCLLVRSLRASLRTWPELAREPSLGVEATRGAVIAVELLVRLPGVVGTSRPRARVVTVAAGAECGRFCDRHQPR